MAEESAPVQAENEQPQEVSPVTDDAPVEKEQSATDKANEGVLAQQTPSSFAQTIDVKNSEALQEAWKEKFGEDPLASVAESADTVDEAQEPEAAPSKERKTNADKAQDNGVLSDDDRTELEQYRQLATRNADLMENPDKEALERVEGLYNMWRNFSLNPKSFILAAAEQGKVDLKELTGATDSPVESKTVPGPPVDTNSKLAKIIAADDDEDPAMVSNEMDAIRLLKKQFDEQTTAIKKVNDAIQTMQQQQQQAFQQNVQSRYEGTLKQFIDEKDDKGKALRPYMEDEDVLNQMRRLIPSADKPAVQFEIADWQKLYDEAVWLVPTVRDEMIRTGGKKRARRSPTTRSRNAITSGTSRFRSPQVSPEKVLRLKSGLTIPSNIPGGKSGDDIKHLLGQMLER